ncbi:MAG: hypothetical protein WCS37_02480 [Chloroflexota bacterium]
MAEEVESLEQFLQEYVDLVGGLWEEVEPQVYDVLWPETEQPKRFTVDPEALAEHPTAQFLTFGLPLLDDMLEQAQKRSLATQVYLDQFHLNPHNLTQQIQRDLTWPEGLQAHFGPAQPRYVTHSVFWFEVTYQSEDRTQSIYTSIIDRYYGRLVRYLELNEVLDNPLLDIQRSWSHPDAVSIPLEDSYLMARERILRNVIPEANNQQALWQERQAQQLVRAKNYFKDLRAELAERVERAKTRKEPVEELLHRGEAIEREAALRLEELQRVTPIQVKIRLLNVLHIKIPRLFVEVKLLAPTSHKTALPEIAPLVISWQPLLEKTDAINCPNCHQPTYVLALLNRQGLLSCPVCNPAVGRS